MIVAMPLVFVLQFWILIGTCAEHSEDAAAWTKSLPDLTIPTPLRK
jgi:hypothetical protein